MFEKSVALQDSGFMRMFRRCKHKSTNLQEKSPLTTKPAKQHWAGVAQILGRSFISLFNCSSWTNHSSKGHGFIPNFLITHGFFRSQFDGYSIIVFGFKLKDTSQHRVSPNNLKTAIKTPGKVMIFKFQYIFSYRHSPV